MKMKPDEAATFALILLIMALAFYVLSAAVSTTAKAHDGVRRYRTHRAYYYNHPCYRCQAPLWCYDASWRWRTK